MTPISMDPTCNCLECRVRRALGERGGVTDTKEAINALGNVMSELLAHLTPEITEAVIDVLPNAVAKWRADLGRPTP